MHPIRPQLLPRPINPNPRGFRFVLIALSAVLGVALVWATFHMVVAADFTKLTVRIAPH